MARRKKMVILILITILASSLLKGLEIKAQNEYVKVKLAMSTSLSQGLQKNTVIKNNTSKSIPKDQEKKSVLPYRTVKVVMSAYCGCSECCGEWSKHNLTASGTIPSRGRTAAAPRSILGSKLEIDGYGTYILEDTGNPKYVKWIDKNTIKVDIYMGNDNNAHERAIKFGIKESTAKLYLNGSASETVNNNLD